MKKMLLVFALLPLVAAGSPAATASPRSSQTGHVAAGGVADPAAYAREIYDPAPRGTGANRPDDFHGYSHETIFSPRLRALFADDEHYAHGEVGRLDWNPFTGTQDDQISDVHVTADPVEGAVDRRVVTVRFRNIGQAQTMILYFERIGRRWYIDDIASPGFGSGPDAQQPWTLSLILKYGR